MKAKWIFGIMITRSFKGSATLKISRFAYKAASPVGESSRTHRYYRSSACYHRTGVFIVAESHFYSRLSVVRLCTCDLGHECKTNLQKYPNSSQGGQDPFRCMVQKTDAEKQVYGTLSGKCRFPCGSIAVFRACRKPDICRVQGRIGCVLSFHMARWVCTILYSVRYALC